MKLNVVVNPAGGGKIGRRLGHEDARAALGAGIIAFELIIVDAAVELDDLIRLHAAVTAAHGDTAAVDVERITGSRSHVDDVIIDLAAVCDLHGIFDDFV